MNELVAYEKFHQNPINKFIHFIGIPLLTFCFMNILSSISIFFEHKRTSIYNGLWVRADHGAMFLFCSYYLYNYGVRVASVMFIYLQIFNVAADYYRKKRNEWFNETIILFFVAWILQFLGHVIEGQQPALMQGVYQSFLVAPLYVVKYIYNGFLVH